MFWASAVLIAYTYFGYPTWLWLRSRWRSRPLASAPFTPFISVVMVVRNEEQFLRRKLQNLLELDYPAELMQILVVSDGSTDGTEAILREYEQDGRVTVLLNQLARGKASGLNDAFGFTQGEVVVLTDVRQLLEPNSVRLLMENFADPAAGCVSGELMLGAPGSVEIRKGAGLYWGFEKSIRRLEGISGSVVGATGALYAVRGNLLVPLPAETILDDVYLPMQVVRQGARVRFDSRVRAWDDGRYPLSREFERKVRTLSGNYQLLQLAPWLLTSQNPIRFEFVSHKLLRLLMPLALAVTLVGSALLSGNLYRTALVLQLAFYGLSLLALLQWTRGPIARLADASLTFVVLNTAALVAFAKAVTGRKAAWGR